jgi:hypothetical protein
LELKRTAKLPLNWEGAMSRKELQKFKDAAAKIAREHNTPEKAREILTKIGYLNADGEVAERYR